MIKSHIIDILMTWIDLLSQNDEEAALLETTFSKIDDLVQKKRAVLTSQQLDFEVEIMFLLDHTIWKKFTNLAN